MAGWVTVGLSPEALVGEAPSFPDVDPKGPILGVFFQFLLSIIEGFSPLVGESVKRGATVIAGLLTVLLIYQARRSAGL